MVAAREYSAAVKTKSFIISLVLLPVMMLGGVVAQRMTRKIVDTTTKVVAVIDHTGGGLTAALSEASDRRNADGITDEATGRQTAPKYAFRAEAVPGDAKALDELRLRLSDEVRRDAIFAFIEIGPRVLNPKIQASGASAPGAAAAGGALEALEAAADALGDDNLIRYTSNRPTNVAVRGFIQGTLTQRVYLARIRDAGLPADQIQSLLIPPVVSNRPLARRADDGAVRFERREAQAAAFIVPIALFMLLFIVVIVGASPLTTNVVEEKQLRIAEVLLGSATPFQIMLGKLLGGVGVGLTLAAVYLGGAIFVASRFEVMHYVTPQLVATFLAFVVLGTLMYGAMFVAAGAAVTNVKEAQSLITPVMLVVMLPMFFLGQLFENPGGAIALAGTFFPLSAPMVTTLRLGIPPGVPGWQLVIAAGATLLATLALVWAAGRIFRVGILMQGHAAKVSELLRWIARG